MRLLSVLFAGVSVFLVGCASAPAPVPEVTIVAAGSEASAVAGMRQWIVADASGSLFVKPPRPSLGTYQRYLLDPPRLHFTPLSGKPSRRQAHSLSRVMGRRLSQEIEKAFGWEPAEHAGPGVIRVRSLVSNIAFSSPDASNFTRTTALVSSSGSVVFSLEFQDALSSESLVRYAVRRPLPGGTFTGPAWHELDRARLVFRRFAADIAPNLAALAHN